MWSGIYDLPYTCRLRHSTRLLAVPQYPCSCSARLILYARLKHGDRPQADAAVINPLMSSASTTVETIIHLFSV